MDGLEFKKNAIFKFYHSLTLISWKIISAYNGFVFQISIYYYNSLF